VASNSRSDLKKEAVYSLRNIRNDLSHYTISHPTREQAYVHNIDEMNAYEGGRVPSPASYLLHARSLFALFSDPEDGEDTIL
jgi:hypothetical protein